MGSTSHRVKEEDKKKEPIYTGEHKFGTAAGMVLDIEDPEEVKHLAEEE